MPDRLVLDASAAIAILRGEAAAPGLARVIRIHLDAGGEVIVPDHFWLELANVLVRRYGHRPDDVVAALRELDEMGVRSIPADRPLTLLGLDLMAAHGLSAYDAVYLALAESEDAVLLTLDADLASSAGDRAVSFDGRGGAGTREPRAAYRRSGVAPNWAAHGAYLSEVRRRTAAAG